MRLHIGEKIEFVVTGNGDVLLRPVTKTVDEVFGRLHKPGRTPCSLAEINEGIRRKIRADM